MTDATKVKALIVTKLVAAFAVSLIAIGGVSPGYAQPGHAAGATQANGHQDRAAARRGHEAFGMAAQPGSLDPNSPAATGGGSLGYNRKLLEY